MSTTATKATTQQNEILYNIKNVKLLNANFEVKKQKQH